MKLTTVLSNIFGYFANWNGTRPIYCVLDEQYNDNEYEGADFHLAYFHAAINARLIVSTDFTDAIEKGFIAPLYVKRNCPELFFMNAINPQDVDIEAVLADLENRECPDMFGLKAIAENLADKDISMPPPITRKTNDLGADPK